MNLRSFAGNSDPLDFSHGLPGTCLGEWLGLVELCGVRTCGLQRFTATIWGLEVRANFDTKLSSRCKKLELFELIYI